MRRSVAVLLGVLLASTSGQVSPLHVHAYSDHDHPEHQHGLAAHDHAGSVPHSDELRVEPCEPGEHVASLVMGCAALPQIDAVDAACTTPCVADPLAPRPSNHYRKDVRVHGPPIRTLSPPRAPPLAFPA